MPEFLYASVYDEHHRFLQVSTDPEDRTVSRPKGLYERLLCASCEGRFARWETYAAAVLKGGVELRFQKEPWGFIVHDVEYPAFKLFGMSLLWRAGVSSRPEFADVQLGAHEEALRAMLHDETPGRQWEYGFSIVFPPEREAQTILGHALASPQRSRYGAHHVYRFFLGVTIWLFFVSSHMQELDESLYSLHEEGSLRVRSGGTPTMEFLKRFGQEIGAAKSGRAHQ